MHAWVLAGSLCLTTTRNVVEPAGHVGVPSCTAITHTYSPTSFRHDETCCVQVAKSLGQELYPEQMDSMMQRAGEIAHLPDGCLTAEAFRELALHYS